MSTLLVIATLAQAIKDDDRTTTSRMLAILEKRLPIEEVFELLASLCENQPLPKPSPRVALVTCA